jgi:hypothetical protein
MRYFFRWRISGTFRKKEAQIEIQAVAKIQYPIKSQNSYANCGPIARQR